MERSHRTRSGLGSVPERPVRSPGGYRTWIIVQMTDLASSAAAGRATVGAVPRTVLSRAAPAVAAYAAIRFFGVAVLAVWSAAEGKSWRTLLGARWDSLWYAGVAEQGYGYTLLLPDGEVHSNLAFFPLLPWLEGALSALVPLSAADAGLLVSWLASLAAAAGLYAIGERLYGPRTGVLLAALWAVMPVSVVQSMAYSEALFTALAAWSCYAVLTERWVPAGTLAALAGLTRPVGIAVVAAVWAAVAVTLWRERARARYACEGVPTPVAAGRPGGFGSGFGVGFDGGFGFRQRYGPLLAGALLAPLGWAGYVLWVGHQVGSPTGYLDVQAGWGNGFDGGLAFAAFIGKLLSGPAPLAGLALVLGLALLGWLYVLGVRQGQPLPLLAYCGTVLLLALTAKGYFGSKPRLMLPAFPLLLPLAAELARWRTRCTAAVLAVAGTGSAVYGAFWLNGSGPP